MYIFSKTRAMGLLAVLAAFAWAAVGPGASIFGGASARLVAFEPLPAYENGESCEWEVAAPQASNLPTSVSQLMPRAASQLPGAPAGLTPRPPLRYIQDAYASFSGVSVDPVHNEVVFNDENKFRVMVYDRLANTPAPGEVTQPKRAIGGLNTRTQYNSGVYIDPKDRHIYVVNNDTVHELTIYGPDKNGDVEPTRMISGTPYGSFGIAADETTGELFFTVQHSGAIMTFPKTAAKDAPPSRMILGSSTQMADPHGIAFDPKNRVLFVANWGASRTPVINPNAPATDPYPRAAVPGSGKFVPPSITVYPADAKGDIAPLHIIQGPKTGLN